MTTQDKIIDLLREELTKEELDEAKEFNADVWLEILEEADEDLIVMDCEESEVYV